MYVPKYCPERRKVFILIHRKRSSVMIAFFKIIPLCAQNVFKTVTIKGTFMKLLMCLVGVVTVEMSKNGILLVFVKNIATIT